MDLIGVSVERAKEATRNEIQSILAPPILGNRLGGNLGLEGLDWYWGIWFGGNFATATVTGTWLPTAPRTQNDTHLRRHELNIEESEGTIMHTKTRGFWECGSPEVDGLDASEPKDRNYPGHMGVTTRGRRRDRNFEVSKAQGTSP